MRYGDLFHASDCTSISLRAYITDHISSQRSCKYYPLAHHYQTEILRNKYTTIIINILLPSPSVCLLELFFGRQILVKPIDKTKWFRNNMCTRLFSDAIVVHSWCGLIISVAIRTKQIGAIE